MADGDEKPPRYLTVADLELGKEAPLDERRKLLSTFLEQSGIALTELGKVAEVPQSMLSQFERGERDLYSEAWSRVLTAMGNLLAEDEAKRKVERTKAEAKLSATLPGDLFLLGMIKSPEEIAEMQQDLDRSRESEQLHGLIAEERGKLADQLVKKWEVELLKPENAPLLLEGWKQLWLAMLEHNRQLAELTGKRHEFVPENVEQVREELKKRVTELEEEIRALREKGEGGA